MSDGPPITTSGLRINVKEGVAQLVERNTVRLELNETGEIIGVLATSPYSAADLTPVKDRTADVRRRLRETAPTRNAGRPALSDDHLREVINEYENATVQQKSYAAAIANRWQVQPATARQWVYKARKRGLLDKRDNTKEGNDG